MHNNPYLFSYDVSCLLRLAVVTKRVKAWKASGQRSVAECWLTVGQRGAMLSATIPVLDAVNDRWVIVQLDPRHKVIEYGVSQRRVHNIFLIT
jgi:hypothetical protein